MKIYLILHYACTCLVIFSILYLLFLLISVNVAPFYFSILYLNMTTLYKKPFENTVGKGENVGNQHFLFFSTMFSTLPKTNFYFSVTFILLYANAFNLDQSKILFGKELRKD